MSKKIIPDETIAIWTVPKGKWKAGVKEGDKIKMKKIGCSWILDNGYHVSNRIVAKSEYEIVSYPDCMD